MASHAEEIKELTEEIKSDFEEFKKSNDERLAQIEKNGKADPLVEEQVTKMNEALTSHEDKLEGLKTELNKLAATINRTGGVEGGLISNDKEIKENAFKFFKMRAALKEKEFNEEQVDVDLYRRYEKAMDKYLRKDERTLDPEEIKALQAGSDPDGGFWLTPTMSNRVSTIVFESSPMRGLATVESISGSSLEMIIDDDEADFGWVGETQSRPETGTPQIGKLEIVANEMYAQPKATQKMLDDAGRNVEQWLSRKVGDRFGRGEAAGFFTGDGVEKPRGILTFTAGTGRKQIEQVSSGAASDVTMNGFIDTETALKVPYRNRATWLMKRTTVGNVRKLKDDNGQYLWQPQLTAQTPPTLLGYPVRLADDMPAVASNALAVAFGDFSQGYTIVDRMGTRVLRDPYTAKPHVKFYTTRRVGGSVTTWEAIKLMKIES